MIRVRPLDDNLVMLKSDGGQDVMMTAKAFSRLGDDVQSKVKALFIVENEINYLSFPDMPHALLVFGSGYGFEGLKKATWLHDCAMYYWGDLDTHGFAILNQLRASFPHVQSFLMDNDTFMAHKHAWGYEPKQETKELSHLSAHEQCVYDDLRSNALGHQLRLEQEHISFSVVQKSLREITKSMEDG